MNILEKKIIKSQELSIIKQIKILDSSRSQHYRSYSDEQSEEKP